MSREVLTVSSYIATLNATLRTQQGRLVGEVSELQLYPGRSYLFFSLKDAKANATIKCIMWKTDYKISGVELENGMEIIVSGCAEIYPANGSLTFKAQAIELVGEGALKKAYDELKKKLDAEGVFSEEKKRAIPSFVQKIGVVTSRDGAVINDFLTNIGRHGFEISLIDSRVEGALATDELIRSVRSFRNKDIDVLVVIRGGGSMESLLPFNNEVLVREIADFPVPVIAGIGHDKDITLVAMAADMMVSTPTAVTAVLNDSWDRAVAYVDNCSNSIMSSYRDVLYATQSWVSDVMSDIKHYFQNIFEQFRGFEFALREKINAIGFRIREIGSEARTLLYSVTQVFEAQCARIRQNIEGADKQIEINNPERLLKLGYTIARVKGKVIKSIKDIKQGDSLSVRLHDGEIEGNITRIT